MAMGSPIDGGRSVIPWASPLGRPTPQSKSFRGVQGSLFQKAPLRRSPKVFAGCRGRWRDKLADKRLPHVASLLAARGRRNPQGLRSKTFCVHYTTPLPPCKAFPLRRETAWFKKIEKWHFLAYRDMVCHLRVLV